MFGRVGPIQRRRVPCRLRRVRVSLGVFVHCSLFGCLTVAGSGVTGTAASCAVTKNSRTGRSAEECCSCLRFAPGEYCFLKRAPLSKGVVDAMRAAALLFLGLVFAAYPIFRPYSSETGSAGAQAFASPAWVVAHCFAMLGFVVWGLVVLYSGRRSDLAIIATWIGVGLVLPYYGAETFALHALGVESATTSTPALIDLADPIRYSPVQTVMFGLGLMLIAVGAVAFALRNRYATVLAVGFVLFLPQFYAPPTLRIAHGLLIALGAIIAARAVLKTLAASGLPIPHDALGNRTGHDAPPQPRRTRQTPHVRGPHDRPTSLGSYARSRSVREHSARSLHENAVD